MAHRPIKAQEDTAVAKVLGDVERAAIPAYSYEGETTGAPSVLHRFLLSVLYDGQMMLIVLEAERTVDCPVVGDGDTAPLAVVVVGGGERGLVLSGEAPPLLEAELRALTVEL